eukprot:1370341-Pyramimonas_sp.AAC.2
MYLVVVEFHPPRPPQLGFAILVLPHQRAPLEHQPARHAYYSANRYTTQFPQSYVQAQPLGAGGLDARAGGLDARAGGLDARADGLDARADGLDARAGGLDAREYL